VHRHRPVRAPARTLLTSPSSERPPTLRETGSEGRERLAHFVFALLATVPLLVLGLVVAYVLWRAWPAFKANGPSYLGNQTDPNLSRELGYAYNGHPAGVPYRALHAWPAVYGTLLTTGGAILVGLPFSLLASIFVAELAPRSLARLIDPLVRILAVVPSVVWGLFGLLVLVPFIDRVLISDNLAARYAPVVQLHGTNILLGILVLTFMTVPFQIAIFTDALRAVPAAWREGGRALGLDAWRTTLKISLPVIRPAIATGVVLATGRAIGEAIALSMTTGSLTFVPNPLDGPVFFLEPAHTLAGLLVDYTEFVDQPVLAADLFSFAALILIAALALMLAVRVVLAPVRAKAVL
jgi:phosphate transport system permease protein